MSQKFFLSLLLVWMCSIVSLNAQGDTTCERSHHVEVPFDNQIFYMFNQKEKEWLYPAHNSYLETHSHAPRSIMDVVWPKWKWHTCRDGYVAVESIRYPDYYLSGWKGYYPYVQYTLFPCREQWSQWKPVQKPDNFPPISDLYIEFKPRFVYENGGSYSGMEAFIHVPPICETVVFVRVLCNFNSTSRTSDNVTFEYQNGIMNGEVNSMKLEVSAEIMAGIGGFSVTDRISATWSSEISTLMHEQFTLNYRTTIPPMKMLKFSQNEVTYGRYRVRSKNLVKTESRADKTQCGL